MGHNRVAGLDVAACYLGEEGLVRHVGQWIHEGDDATGIRDLLLQFECYVQADVPAADDEKVRPLLTPQGGQVAVVDPPVAKLADELAEQGVEEAVSVSPRTSPVQVDRGRPGEGEQRAE